MNGRALCAFAWYGKVKAKISTQQQVSNGIFSVLNIIKRYFLLSCATL